MDNLFNNFVKFVTNEKLDKMAKMDEIFCQYDERLNELYSKMEEMKLEEEDKKVILELLETQVAQSARLTDIACRRAAVELLNFLKTLGAVQNI